jgi:plasmid stabilization system protein ParE
MARPVEVHPEAVLEAQAAYNWYHDRNDTAAEAFLAELDRAVELISESSMRWPIYLHGTRHFLLRRFPFVLFIVSSVKLFRSLRSHTGAESPVIGRAAETIQSNPPLDPIRGQRHLHQLAERDVGNFARRIESFAMLVL